MDLPLVMSTLSSEDGPMISPHSYIRNLLPHDLAATLIHFSVSVLNYLQWYNFLPALSLGFSNNLQ